MNDAPNLRSRELGARLRELTEAAGYAGNQLAAEMGISQATVSRLFSGKRGYDQLRVATLLGFCKAPAAEQAEILELLTSDADVQDRRDGWWVRPHHGLPSITVRSVQFAYATARSVVCYYPDGLPPILRIEELMANGPGDPAEAVLAAWREYRALLSNPAGAAMLFYLRESRLRSLDIPERIREDQIIDLAMLAGQKWVVVRVVPTDRETELPAGGFSLLRFADAEPAVCVPCETVTLILEHEHVDVYQNRSDVLDAIALSEQDSRDVIMDLSTSRGPAAAGV